MSNIGVAMLVILSLALIILIVLMFVLLGKKETKVEQEKTSRELDIYDLLEFAKNKNTSKSKLTDIVLEFAQSFPIPAKNNGVIPSNAKVYLDLVFAIVYNTNSDAKLIAFMDKELKKQNPAYADEIEQQEDKAIKKRKTRSQI